MPALHRDIPYAMRALKAASWLGTPEPQTLLDLAEAAYIETHGPGTTIAQRGELCSHLIIVVSGFLVVGVELANGSRHVNNLLGPGQAHALIPLLDEGPVHHDARTKGWVELLLIPRDAFIKAMAQDAALNWAVLRGLCRRNRYLTEALAERTALPVSVQLGCVLLRLFEQYGEKLTISQEDLSEILGVTRQTVSRELRQMQLHGLINIARGQIRLLNKNGLVEASGH